MELNLIKTDLVNIGEIELIQELDGYRFPNRVYKNYIWNTNNNRNLSYEDAKKKLIRNIVLGVEARMIKGMEHKKVYYYGCLQIHVNINEKSICYIKNNFKGVFPWNVNADKIHILNEIMGIEGDK